MKPFEKDRKCFLKFIKISLNFFTAATEFCQWAQAGNDVYIIYHCKYKVRPHSSPLFSVASAAIAYRNQQNKSSASEVNFRLVIVVKGFLKLPNLLMLMKQNLADVTFGGLLLVFSTSIPSLFNGLEVLPSASDKVNLRAENVSKNSSAYCLLSLLDLILNLHNIPVTPRLVKKVIIVLHSSMVCGPDCIWMMVLRNCEPEFSHMFAELFNICLKESPDPGCYSVSSVDPAFENSGERSKAKNYHPVTGLARKSAQSCSCTSTRT